MKKKKHFMGKVLLAILIVVVALVISGTVYLKTTKNPRVRLLSGIMHFTESTLQDEGYLLYDIDIMELCRVYMNGDTQVSGTMGLSHMEKIKSSISMDVDAKRSFSQKRMAEHIDMDFLFLNAGEMILYGEDDTVYLDAPLLGEDVGYAFPTGINMFRKAPDLTSDINQAWFRDHTKDIVDLMGKIKIEETGKTITIAKGKTCEEFVVTIPKGEGDFIWELLGMEAPDYDVVVSEYLDEKNHICRIEMDLSEELEGATMVFDGENLGMMQFVYLLPEDERVEMTLVRNAKYKNWIDSTINYYTNTDEVYSIISNMTWNNEDKGFALKIKDMHILCDDKELAQGFFKGKVIPLSEEPDVFEGREEYLYQLEVLDWRAIRADSEGFINDVLDKTSFGVMMEE